jgi:hypothetical protein
VSIPATVSGALQWQYYDGAAWQNFGPPFDLGSLKRTRRAGIAPAPPSATPSNGG